MVVQVKKWVEEKGLLDRSIFTSEQIYQLELERIFARSWLFIGHESLVANPNDFFLTYMGEDPIILTRDSRGKVHAFLNMCMHRGNRIVRADRGNAKSFMCAYHGWTFANDGHLASVPGFQEAYYGELPVDKLGLVEVAQLDTYAGFVFATWDPEAPGLDSFFGDFRYYLDIGFNRRDSGTEMTHPQKWILPTNWKSPVDNAAGDAYHGPTAHASSHLVQAKFAGTRPTQITPERWKVPGNQVSAANGHGLSVSLADEGDVLRRGTWTKGGIADRRFEYEAATKPEAIRRLGEYRANRVRPGHVGIFPNMFWLGVTVRQVHPRGPLNSEVWAYCWFEKEMPAQVKQDSRLQYQRTFGPSGMHEQDDMDNWRSVTQGGLSPIARRTTQNISMGVGHEWNNPGLPSETSVGRAFSEVNQRSYYLQWQKYMQAESWKDVKLSPITANFEGTATLHG